MPGDNIGAKLKCVNIFRRLLNILVNFLKFKLGFFIVYSIY